ncbi:multicopper oxidase domain-containing protein [soil metagenome]
MKLEKLLLAIIMIGSGLNGFAQNPLFIPPTLSGTTFNLDIQNGVTQFYPGINTNTYGINGPLLAPTLIINKWDWITMNVSNNLTGSGNATTIHWHGLHVPAMADGGPHQVINQGTTWSPVFQMLNSAGTFWYHPHGDNKTDRHVSKGIAGMIIVKDSLESGLNLPRTYGTDDFPIIVQSKAFDVLNQIAIATELDTAICVNGTINPYLNVPAQIIRLRLLNGSSSRSYNFGFTGNQQFYMIAGDAGLLDNTLPLTRIKLSPGERAEILLDLQGMNGQTIYLNSFSSEFPNGIYGASTVTGMMGGTIPDYNLNPLNGANFSILRLNIIAQTLNPVVILPTSLSTNIPWTGYTVTRNFNLRPDTMMSSLGQVAGPFNINGVHFDMNVINETVYLNDIEKWRITNNTGIAHPFHIHDMPFYLLNINGNLVPDEEKGKKDVVLVMPGQYVEFITKFEDFADNSTPYMYHCHLLHHEDDGMMGSFLVIDTTSTGIHENNDIDFSIFPNPTRDQFQIKFSEKNLSAEIHIKNIDGTLILSQKVIDQQSLLIPIEFLSNGMYFIEFITKHQFITKKFIKL